MSRITIFNNEISTFSNIFAYFINFHLQIHVLDNMEILGKFFKSFDRNVIKLLCLFWNVLLLGTNLLTPEIFQDISLRGARGSANPLAHIINGENQCFAISQTQITSEPHVSQDKVFVCLGKHWYTTGKVVKWVKHGQFNFLN